VNELAMVFQKKQLYIFAYILKKFYKALSNLI